MKQTPFPSLRMPLLSLCLIALAALSPAAPLTAEGLTPAHLARLRNARDVAVAPDGAAVAYTLRVPRMPLRDEDGSPWVELHLLDAAGESRPFITGEVNISDIAWRPAAGRGEGAEIAFLAERGGDEHDALYAISTAGGEARRLLTHGEDIEDYSFSPDGRRVAFLAEEPEEAGTKALEKQGFKQRIFEEDVAATRVWIADLEGGGEPRALDLPGSASAVHWSPAGDRLVVVLAPTPLIDDEYMRSKAHVVSLEPGAGWGRVEGVVATPGKLETVAWSPDGSRLALLAGSTLDDPEPGRLMVAEVSGAAVGAPRDLLPELEGHVRALAWKDARTLIYVAAVGVWTHLGEVTLDGERRLLVDGEGGPVWWEISAAPGGRLLALLGETPRHPEEVFTLAAGETTPRRRTDSNPWLAEVELAPQEVVRYTARDGEMIEALLLRPLGEEPGHRYPLILMVHGGPEAHNGQGWLTSYSQPGQLAAARGFAVLYPNYRGSTGRGVAFSKADRRDFAGRQFDDLVDGIDHLVERGLVDGERVGITGSSYGGYASAWGATYYSRRFAAAVVMVGISDVISKFGTTDIPEEGYLVHQGLRPWENWQLFLERSPIYHAGGSRTPTLIAGGTEDRRVHPSQSLELYRHLKTRGEAPVRLVRYPGEHHGNRKAAARLDYQLRLLRWMEHYLQGPGGAPPPPELDYGAALGLGEAEE